MRVPVRMLSGANSNDPGSVYAVVDQAVRAPDGTVLIAAETPVSMQVNKQQSRGVGKPGSIGIQMQSTRSVDGQSIPLRGNYYTEGQSRKGKAIGTSAGLCVGGCLAGNVLYNIGYNSASNYNNQNPDANTMMVAGYCLTVISPAAWFFLLLKGDPAYMPNGLVVEQVSTVGSYEITAGK